MTWSAGIAALDRQSAGTFSFYRKVSSESRYDFLELDQPICMIEVADSNLVTPDSDPGAVSYYHFDALGSCVALSGADGNTAVLYEYSFYGRVASSDPNHPNRFMLTGREFDADTGLYCYRARYYHPEIGRFLQTDPIGYGDGMNWYAYCGNRPIGFTDPSGNTGGYVFLSNDGFPGFGFAAGDACDVNSGSEFIRYFLIFQTGATGLRTLSKGTNYSQTNGLSPR